MKRFLTSLSLILLCSGLIPATALASSTYSGAAGSNYYATTVLQAVSGSNTEKTTAAANSSSNDITLYQTAGSAIILGFDEQFDGLSADVYTSASGGAYFLQYWSGHSWENLINTTSASISDSNSGTFKLEWSRPSNWTKTSLNMAVDEDGRLNQTTNSMYFVKLTVESAYSNSATFSQIGLIDYNWIVTLQNQSGSSISSPSWNLSNSASSGDSNLHASKTSGNTIYLAYHTENPTNYSYTFGVNGYVSKSSSISLSAAQTNSTLNFDYGYIATVVDENGNTVSSASVYAGSSYGTSCTYISNGQYGCAVSTSSSSTPIEIYKSGSTTLYTNFSSIRDSGTDGQVNQSFTLYSSSTNNNDNSGEPDLTVNDLYLDGDDLKIETENEGDDDVSSSDTVYLYIYIDGDRELSTTLSTSYFEEGETSTFTALSGTFDDSNQDYDVEVCIDATDDVNESDENNNCRTETLSPSSSSNNNDLPDLDVTDISINSDGELTFDVENNGNDDVDNGDEAKLVVYIDGDSQWSKTVTQSSSSTNFLDEGESDTYNAGDILDNEGSHYDVEVCVDTEDDIDEDNENNNCMSVDEDSIGDNNSNNNDSCGNFYDISNHWAETYICDLYDRDIVDGRSSTYFYPDYSVTRAEFLKMVLLDAELDPYSVSSVHYGDVSSGSWYYSYVTYATAMNYVDGYSDSTFKPNNSITRAEALAILMRVADENGDGFNENDINFWDVDVNDWYAYAVVIADDDNLVDGYSDGSFRPDSYITRGEASKIVDLAYDKYFK